MRSSLSRRIAAACLGAAFVILVACGEQEQRAVQPETEGAPVEIRIGYLRVLSGLPLYVALDKGLFRQAGFSPKPVVFRSSDLAFKALERGEIDLVGVAGLSQALQVVASDPSVLELLGVLYSSTALVASSNALPPIAVTDLGGTDIGIFPGSVFGRYAREALTAEGLPAESLQLVPLPPPLQLQSLKDGSVAALFTLEPIGATAVADGFGQYVTKDDLFTKHFLGGAKFPGGCIAVRRSFSKRTPGASDKIVNVFRTAVEEISTAEFEMSPYLQKYTLVRSDLASQLTFEGASLGNDMEAQTLQLLVARLKEWEILDAAFDIQNAMPLDAVD